MPIYEYHCHRCGERFSLLRPMRESDAQAVCPKCGAAGVKRAPSVIAARRCGPAG